MKDLTGVFTALVTPFFKGEIDWDSLKLLVRKQMEGGIDGLVLSGTTGESPTLSKEEKRKLFEFVKSETGGKIPLMFGTGTNSTSESIEATQAAEKWGADAALVVVPYYNKPPQRGLFQHFQKIAESTKLPIVLYNVPGRTITRLEVETIAELSQISNIVGIKEATGEIPLTRDIIRESNKDFFVTSGDDGTFLQLISVGAKGVISVAGNLMPAEFSAWCRRARQGDTGPQDDFQGIAEFNSYLYCEANPIPVKMALHLMGTIRSPEMRLPLVQLGEPQTHRLRDLMTKVGLL